MSTSDVIMTYLRDQHLTGRADVELTADTQLIEQEVLDSLAIFSMVTFLEDEFSITIEPEDVTLENFSSIPAIEALVAEKQAADAAQP